MDKIHFTGVMNVEFDLNKETGEITNFSMTSMSSQSKKEPKKKEPKPVVLSPQEKAEQMPCIFVNPKTQQMRFTRAAAERLGFLNDQGMVWQTPNGKNMRVAIGFRMQKDGFILTISGEFDDNPTSSPMLSDSLRLTCPMVYKDIFKNFEVLKVEEIPMKDGEDRMFTLKNTTVDEMATLYDKVQLAQNEMSDLGGNKQGNNSTPDEGQGTASPGCSDAAWPTMPCQEAASTVVPDPQIANGPMPISDDDMEDLYHTQIKPEDGENANGADSKGKEFIPSFGEEEKIHDSVDDDDDIMSGEFDPKKDDDDIFE